jgi:hypothetical protein
LELFFRTKARNFFAIDVEIDRHSHTFGAVLFGITGYAAYRYGKKASLPTTKWIGIALMLYPYAISRTWLLYAVCIGLCIGVYVSSRQ